ncbi:methylated-DNA--[protein]-cysteine S-methyltransferase [Arthrobacter castelli]|uniref:methylated-DNA--[protein]-cysteine S-methyltransferase n=1 Tax=Arthrobacter castelli TaxID=271431 RepID=UPI0003F811F5|nr:methylated-DNA--[protein]-cysteine S-methyltransferase [Arthrobacter castelli]
MKTHTTIDSPIGMLTLVNTDGVLSAAYMGEQARMPNRDSFGSSTSAGFEAATEQLNEYFAGDRQEFSLPMAPEGSPFQQRVWQLLTEIPYGQTRTYGQLADELGNRHIVRAVGSANGRNPISIIVPCHRVIGADGSLTGYGGGLERKRFLLDLENPARTHEPALF